MRFVERSYTRGHWLRLFVLMEPTIMDSDHEKRVIETLTEWCTEQFGPGGKSCAWEMSSTGALTFHDLRFALAFKLRWMTSAYIQG